jgi:UDP-N-acetylmuramoylalanine--D-glutamate ligase
MERVLETPIALLGLGISGRAARRLLKLAGVANEQIAVLDKDPAKATHADGESLMRDFKPRTLVVSPGYPLSTPWIRQAQASGVKITSEINLACATLRGERIIGVTGALGKSTTVSLIGAGLRAVDANSFTGGNLGEPLADYAADVLEGKRPRANWIALELSSFQLENCAHLKLETGVITYLCANHLERYASLRAYYDWKWSIATLGTPRLVLNAGSADLVKDAEERGIRNAVWASRDRGPLPSSFLEAARLPGLHNQDNLCVAAAALQASALPEACVEALGQFPGLAHRLENLGCLAGVHVFNDSKATSIVSVESALASLLGDRRFSRGTLYCLLGGRDKKLPWKDLASWRDRAGLRFAFFGEAATLIKQDSGLEGEVFQGLRAALEALRPMLKPEDTLLLSPGGTSLDEFKNFEDRGERFGAWARELFGKATYGS